MPRQVRERGGVQLRVGARSIALALSLSLTPSLALSLARSLSHSVSLNRFANVVVYNYSYIIGPKLSQLVTHRHRSHRTALRPCSS